MTRTFYIFRHALATKSKRGYGKKILDAHILPKGIPPIKKLANFLKDTPSDINVSSQFLRCKETVDIVSQISGKQFVFDARLNEYYLETFSEFKKTVKEFLDEISDRGYKNIVICTHGAVIAGLKNLIINKNFTKSQFYDYPYFAILTIIRINTKKSIEEMDFNVETNLSCTI